MSAVTTELNEQQLYLCKWLCCWQNKQKSVSLIIAKWKLNSNNIIVYQQLLLNECHQYFYILNFNQIHLTNQVGFNFRLSWKNR